MPVTCAAMTPGTRSKRLVYDASPATRAGEPATGPRNWTMASMGAVGLPGKSRLSASVTMRGAGLGGRAGGRGVATHPPPHGGRKRRAEAEQQRHDRHRVEQSVAHDAVREPVPA